MTISTEWQQIAIYAVLAALALALVQRIPFIGPIVRFAFSIGLLALCLFILFQQAPYEPSLARIAERLGVNSQEVSGGEVRIRMSPDGHFWARATINGVERRMLVDSGATITAISEDTARAASVGSGTSLVPVVLQTANGLAQARTGSVKRLELGSITARDLKVAISPALGDMNVLGMNFLSDLASWRVEGRTLILVPKARAEPARRR
ncbi:retropepsin-like aspartic protease family protein [Sphingomonas desiccabilis]|uniref:TIGR02281 family clan AA aspartic protease n=1 Tax=Sphingomonas desiccabilis TaxID=429134 RepID=A0A4Q2J1B6_9SPHN|nr:retropepsin-like aspartic protease [Sphingomonas desiccabilis]MBB3910933.1 aspartyl protease family protein [Sphingomonas desiccabilis]RXZ35523.1 TIGR02281 family clan AA aspartic protease [Sphingomonas desiccabilis]